MERFFGNKKCTASHYVIRNKNHIAAVNKTLPWKIEGKQPFGFHVNGGFAFWNPQHCVSFCVWAQPMTAGVTM